MFSKLSSINMLSFRNKKNEYHIIKEKLIVDPQWIEGVMAYGQSPNWNNSHVNIWNWLHLQLFLLSWEVLMLILVVEKCFACCLIILVHCYSCKWIFLAGMNRHCRTKLIHRNLSLFFFHFLIYTSLKSILTSTMSYPCI